MTAAAVAEAPGRVNLIGEHTDYNGGWVLPMATALRTRVAVRLRDDARIRGESQAAPAVEAEWGDPPSGTWLDYASGVGRELVQCGRMLPGGFEIRVESDVPQGAGLSSSAALEVATALALAAAAGRPFEERERAEVASLCQRAESDFVGVPCGIMDPWAALFGRAGRAVKLRCADLRWELVPLPDSLEVWIVDTGVRRALRDGAYAARREECTQALEGARLALGRPLDSLSDLSATDLARLEAELEPAPRRRARHVVGENARVHRFVEALRSGDLALAGEQLYASHESLRSDYEVTCAESDFLVDATRDLSGAIGARMTGAGWGGCTLHLVRAGSSESVVRAVAARFEDRFGRRPPRWKVLSGDGAPLLRSGRAARPADRRQGG
jgi:galactokinase